MYGINVWVIHQQHQGKRYYFKDIEGGKRLWTTSVEQANMFVDKQTALSVWENDLKRTGVITGATF